MVENKFLRREDLKRAIRTAINKAGLEEGSDTPDFVLADYLMECLAAFDRAVNTRTINTKRSPCRCSVHIESTPGREGFVITDKDVKFCPKCGAPREVFKIPVRKGDSEDSVEWQKRGF